MSWDDDHCPVTELLRATCVHCRPAPERARLDAMQRALTQPTPMARANDIAPDRHFEAGPIVAAKYTGGICRACEVPIVAGEHIRLYGGDWCHADCV